VRETTEGFSSSSSFPLSSPDPSSSNPIQSSSFQIITAAADNTKCHSTLIFPERVWLDGLQEIDVKIVMDYVLDPKSELTSLLHELKVHREKASRPQVVLRTIDFDLKTRFCVCM
jgi:hypothetical protein